MCYPFTRTQAEVDALQKRVEELELSEACANMDKAQAEGKLKDLRTSLDEAAKEIEAKAKEDEGLWNEGAGIGATLVILRAKGVIK